eukprot:COSAG01_NODE_53654_length_337_cov_1.378151_1_plen_43_part_01
MIHAWRLHLLRTACIIVASRRISCCPWLPVHADGAVPAHPGLH